MGVWLGPEQCLESQGGGVCRPSIAAVRMDRPWTAGHAEGGVWTALLI